MMDFDALVNVNSGLGTAAVIVMNKQVIFTLALFHSPFPELTFAYF